MKRKKLEEVESALRGEWFYLRRKPIDPAGGLPAWVGAHEGYLGTDGSGFAHFRSMTVQLLRMTERGARFRLQDGKTFWLLFQDFASYAEVRLIPFLDSPRGRCILHPCCRETPVIGDACTADRLKHALAESYARRCAEVEQRQAWWARQRFDRPATP